MAQEKSLYEMTQEELAELPVSDFTSAYIRTNSKLVEEWQNTTWLNKNGDSGKSFGRNQTERDLNIARMAVQLQNTVEYYYGKPSRDTHYPVAEAVKRMHASLPENAKLPETSLEFGEAAGVATTGAWSNATLLPMVLGYARKIMPKLSVANSLYQIQPLDRPNAPRVFFVTRTRDNNNSTDGQVEQRAGWSYRSWIDDPGENTAITKAATFAISSADAPAPKAHKIQASTTIELEQDLQSLFGWDAVALVSEIATDEMALELDEILLENIYRRGSVNGIGTFQYGALPTVYQYDPSAYDKRVHELLARGALNMFHQRRVTPNWFVSGTDWQLLLANTSLYATNAQGEVALSSYLNPQGTLKVGGGINHYVVPLPFPISEGIMGRKGTDYVDGSAFYLPYIPLQLTGMLYDPNTMKRTLSWISRYSIYNHTYSGKPENYAYFKTNSAITNLSYPSAVEYT